MTPDATRAAPRLLLVGGGHAMLPALTAARAWTEAGASVRLVSDHRFLYYSGMVPEWLGGVYSRNEARIDLEALCARAGVPFVEARAARLDPTAKTLTTAAGDRLCYDLIALDIGAVNPGEPGAAIRTKPLHHLERLAHRLDEILQAPPAPFRLAIVGGGAAGVEIALNISARFAAHHRAEDLALHLVEGAERLLPEMPASLGAYAAKRLTSRGVYLHLDAHVTGVDDGTVQLSTRAPIRTDAVLWATGPTGPPLFREAHLPCDGRGFVRVNPALQCLADPRIFAAGDCAAIHGMENLARIGVHAVKQGPVLRDNLARSLRALRAQRMPKLEELLAFKPYPIAPLILSTGEPKGLWTAGPWWFHAGWALRLKHFIDRCWMAKYCPDSWGEAGFFKRFDAAAALRKSSL